MDGKDVWLPLDRCEAKAGKDSLELDVPSRERDQPEAALRVTVKAALGGTALDFAYEAAGGLEAERVKLLDEALWVSARRATLLVPVREGLLIPADNGVYFRHEFDTYTYEGCHMEMLGLVREGAAALVTWDDPYVVPEVKSDADPVRRRRSPARCSRRRSPCARPPAPSASGSSARATPSTIARAYREVAKEKG